MPRSSEHRAKAERNRAVLARLDVAVVPDWAVVVAFYTAVHLAERLAARDGIHHDNHTARNTYLAEHPDHSDIHDAYMELYYASLTARYATLNRFARDYPPAVVQSHLIATHLAAVEAHVAAAFAPPPPPAPEDAAP